MKPNRCPSAPPTLLLSPGGTRRASASGMKSLVWFETKAPKMRTTCGLAQVHQHFLQRTPRHTFSQQTRNAEALHQTRSVHPFQRHCCQINGASRQPYENPIIFASISLTSRIFCCVDAPDFSSVTVSGEIGDQVWVYLFVITH